MIVKPSADLITKDSSCEDSNYIFNSNLSQVIKDVRQELGKTRQEDGHWLFELEADTTIPAEYILLGHFLNERDVDTEQRLAKYIRSNQENHGGWPLFPGGRLDVSCSVKAYWALKLVGDKPSEPHMQKACEAILNSGGAAKSNVFTRTTLALFEQVPWRAVPSMPVEIIFLPQWFPFHLNKISYWSRTTLVPLMVLMSLRPKARNPTNTNIKELFCKPVEEEIYFKAIGGLSRIFFILDRLLVNYEKIVPTSFRRKAIDKALKWCTKRLNGEDGLGAIFPPMANLLMVLDTLGYGKDDALRTTVRKSIDLLLTSPSQNQQYCQPCLSPVWDTGLAVHAMLEAGESPNETKMLRTLDWLVEKQIKDVKGDWSLGRKNLSPGGWAFQYNNDYYPDVDDTAVVALALHRANSIKYSIPIKKARDWVIGMQGKDGGWGAFDADNNFQYLNHIPFADHGALLDPSTVDVTARCVSFLCQIGEKNHLAVKKAIDFLLAEQEEDGSWFGRWGTNYIYGTWSVLCALNAAGINHSSNPIRKAVSWIYSKQRADGGWGETGNSYYHDSPNDSLNEFSTASQTAWAVLGLMSVGEVESNSTKLGISFLLELDRDGPKWKEDKFTAVGFPRVFYLRYHGYSAYFPLWALARYNHLMDSNNRCHDWGL